MKLSNLLEKWGMKSLKITPPFLQMEWTPKAADKDAAWARCTLNCLQESRHSPCQSIAAMRKRH